MSSWQKSDYMEQEEEWEREGVLNPDWEKQQKKVFVRKIISICVEIFFSVLNI